MASLKERVKAPIAVVRRRFPVLDHGIRMQQHYGEVKASQQAGAVTYFGFLSVFPVLALAFFAVGYVSKVFPDAQEALLGAIDEMFPNLIGSGEGKLDLSEIQDSAGTVGLFGLVGVLYAGLGWLSALRSALNTVFGLSNEERPNFLMGKARDLMALVVIGVVMVFTVGVTGVIAGFSEDLLQWLNLNAELGWVVQLLTVVLGLVANAVLFFVMFRLLASPNLPRRALISGALLGAVGFEVLKQLSAPLIGSTQGNPAFQVFGLALILVVWINYFSRVVLYAAAWAQTAPESV
ncbi:YihY/virulence factor BrkB family protein [Nocardioides sp.]|uniref:YihY/virulence factor BrkB family protein n=1 Tax=Nocardioides sp. TaxID=35761 RepID=UPI0035688644